MQASGQTEPAKARSDQKKSVPKRTKQTHRISKRKSSTRRAKPTQPVTEQTTKYGRATGNLVDRGKAALADAYNWIGETGTVVPRLARKANIAGISGRLATRKLADAQPILLGAAALGLGALVGGLLIASSGVGVSRKGAGNTSAPTSKSRGNVRKKR